MEEVAILAQGHFHSNILTQGEVVFVVPWCVLCLHDSGDCLVVVFQAQKRCSWIPGKERAERVLANAISIDGRKEWTCKFCLESNVWTMWRCRRCYNNIPAGLHAKYRQAFAAKSGEWSTGSSASSGQEDRKARCVECENELRARIVAMEKKEGGQKVPGDTW